MPYKGVDGLIDDLCRRLAALSPAEREALLPAGFAVLARLFPQLRQLAGRVVAGDSGASLEARLLRPRAYAFAELGELLRRTAPCPVLAIDDLQWGDLDSVALLADLLQAPAPVPLLLVACYRTEEAEANPVLRALAAALDELSGRADVRTVEVGELDGARGWGQLVTARCSKPMGARATCSPRAPCAPSWPRRTGARSWWPSSRGTSRGRAGDARVTMGLRPAGAGLCPKPRVTMGLRPAGAGLCPKPRVTMGLRPAGAGLSFKPRGDDAPLRCGAGLCPKPW